MNYKLLLISAFMFTTLGIIIGTFFNKDPNTSTTVIVLACISLIFLAFILTSFNMLRKQNKNGKEAGYAEAISDVMNTAEELYGVQEAQVLARATQRRLTRPKPVKGNGKVHVHMHQ